VQTSPNGIHAEGNDKCPILSRFTAKPARARSRATPASSTTGPIFTRSFATAVSRYIIVRRLAGRTFGESPRFSLSSPRRCSRFARLSFAVGYFGLRELLAGVGL
jgi:hypothetical protein